MKTEERTKLYYKPYNDNMIFLSDNDCIPPIRVSLYHYLSSLHMVFYDSNVYSKQESCISFKVHSILIEASGMTGG